MSSSIVPTPGIPLYDTISKNETAKVAAFEKSDTVTAEDIAYFKKIAPTLTSATALLKNYKALTIVLSAYGMSANISQTGLLKDLMTQNPTSSKSAATQIGSALYMRFAKAMNQFTTAPFATTASVNAVISALGTNNFETHEDKISPGIAAALYFKRVIGSYTTLVQLMSDPVALSVATTSTNMPTQFGTLDYAQQVRMLTPVIHMKDFQNSAKVDKFITQYLAINEASNTTVADPSGALATLSGSGDTTNMLSYLKSTSSSSTPSVLSLFA